MNLAGPTFRAATAADVDAAVPLIHSSGPEAFDYVFAQAGKGDAQGFLRHAFSDGAGEFGWRNHVVGELEGVVVAAGAGFTGQHKGAFMWAAVRQILSCYGVRHAPGVLLRGLRVESVIPPPSAATYYLGHLGVAAPCRGKGVGAALVAYLLAARPASATAVVLDVAATNPRAEQLYRRMGFTVVGERPSKLVNPQGHVATQRRMQWQSST